MVVLAAESNQIEIADDKIKYTVMLAVPKGASEARVQHPYSGLRMNAVGVLVVLSIALLLSATTVQGAALAASTVSDNPTSLPTAVTTTETSTTTTKICHNSTPCGWAVYVPYTRRVDYFMRNTCNCPSDKSCQRYEDDLSVSAYVYRCGEKQQTTENLDVPSD